MKKIIHKKLELAEQLLEHMPPKLAETLKSTGSLVIEELYKGTTERPHQDKKPEPDKNKLNEVTIE